MHGLLVGYSRHGLNNGPFDERTVLDHLNPELLVQYSDPHCIQLIISRNWKQAKVDDLISGGCTSMAFMWNGVLDGTLMDFPSSTKLTRPWASKAHKMWPKWELQLITRYVLSRLLLIKDTFLCTLFTCLSKNLFFKISKSFHSLWV